jgi:rhodanese-related sulfurtransferase
MYKDIDSKAFEAGIKENPNAVVIDVRSAGEFHSGMIPGAINIDLMGGDFADRIKALDKNKAYYLYCRSGNRSGMAAGAMSQWGFDEVYNLAGGIMYWGGEVSTPEFAR